MNTPTTPATTLTTSVMSRIGIALDTAFHQHLNLMLRPHMARQLRAAAASLAVPDADGQPGASYGGGGGPRSDFAVPFLGESLIAAMDMSGRSPARSSGGAMSSSFTRAGSTAGQSSTRANSISAKTRGGSGAFAIGSPDLVRFTAFDDELEGANKALEDLEEELSPGRRGPGSRSGEPSTSPGQGLQRFTAFEAGLPGADMALEDDSSPADGSALAEALERTSLGGHDEDAQQDAVETADEWGIRPFGAFGGQEEDLSLEEMAAPAASGTSPTYHPAPLLPSQSST